MKKSILAILIGALAIVNIGVVEGDNIAPKERVFFIEERILFKDIPKEAKSLDVWIPYPVSDDWQAIYDFELISPFDTKIILDKKYGNRVIYLKQKTKFPDKKDFEIMLSFKVHRKECRLFNDSSAYDEISNFLKADRLVPVNGKLKSLAKEITKDRGDDLEKVRAIYDYIIDELTYSKDDPRVCGIGDSLLTLQHKKGICTDYHSLFISLVRSLGIPAKFEIGFRIPDDKSEGRLNGYHCWAKFYLKGKGWIPVDISEADKHPEKRDYFFGHIDENRVHLTSGRDINLEYAKYNQPLNFFVYPYNEFDGIQSAGMDIELSFRDLRGGG